MKETTIGLIAPSFRVNPDQRGTVARINKALKGHGINTILGKNIFKSDHLETATIAQRVADIHAAYKDHAIDIVMTYAGGFSANQLLPHMDWDLIKRNNKPLVGHSDITVLCNAIFAMTGQVTFYGPNYRSFAQGKRGLSHVSITNFIETIVHRAFSAQSFYATTWYDSSLAQRGVVSNKVGPQILQSGTATGTCLGGNVGTLFLLQGTPWMPRLTSDYILLLEDDDLPGKFTLQEFDRKLESWLQQPGAAKHIQGLLIGRFQKNSRVQLKQLAKIVLSKPALRKKPIIADLSFGHPTPRALMPIGGSLAVRARHAEVTFKYEYSNTQN